MWLNRWLPGEPSTSPPPTVPRWSMVVPSLRPSMRTDTSLVGMTVVFDCVAQSSKTELSYTVGLLHQVKMALPDRCETVTKSCPEGQVHTLTHSHPHTVTHSLCTVNNTSSTGTCGRGRLQVHDCNVVPSFAHMQGKHKKAEIKRNHGRCPEFGLRGGGL